MTVSNGSQGRVVELVDDRGGITRAECAERIEVPVLLDQEPSGDGHSGRPGQLLVPQHDLDEGPAGTAVAVGKRVDGLELGMSDGDLRQQREVVAGREPEQVVDGVRNAPVVRGDVVGVDRCRTASADPDRLLSPADQMRRVSFQEDALDATIPSAVRASAVLTASAIACMLSAMTTALLEPEPVSSASAMARAEALICSIWEDDADSDRRRTAVIAPRPCPVDSSKRAISKAASSASAIRSAGRASFKSAILAGMADL